ncbi:hypothetical protein V6R21_12545 [Limibacter armeniacum]|uniref:hypothetical protein n=1 Tax=Limibacter armeniacum TaxID=466084 RepID=UPI002FE66C35
MVAFLHTSSSHIKRFDLLLSQNNIQTPVTHFVNEELLQSALTDGKVDLEGFHDQINRIKEKGFLSIVCTCSTYGVEADKLEGVERIDRPAVEYLLQNYKKIVVAFTANATKVSTLTLFKEVSDSLGMVSHIEFCDCSAAWAHFENGNMEAYELAIADFIKSVAEEADAVFLAQASMEGAKKYLTTLNIEIVSSALLGVRYFLK